MLSLFCGSLPGGVVSCDKLNQPTLLIRQKDFKADGTILL